MQGQAYRIFVPLGLPRRKDSRWAFYDEVWADSQAEALAALGLYSTGIQEAMVLALPLSVAAEAWVTANCDEPQHAVRLENVRVGRA